MATVRFVPPPAENGSIAAQFLQAHAADFNRRWAEAQAAADLEYEADTAEYSARLRLANEQIAAARREAADARDQLARIDLAEPKGAASAAKTLANLNTQRAVASTMAGAAGAGTGGTLGDEDETWDDFQTHLRAHFPAWSDVISKGVKADELEDLAAGATVSQEARDKAAIDAAMAEAARSGAPPRLRPLVAVAHLEQTGSIPSTGLGELRDAAIREAFLGNSNFDGYRSEFLRAIKAIGAGAGSAWEGLNTALDDVSERGNTPAEAAALQAAKRAAKAAPKQAKAAAITENIANAGDLTPDYAAARQAAEARLRAAEEQIASVELPTRPVAGSRIERTREQYRAAFGGPGGRRGRQVDDDGPSALDQLLAEIEGAPTPARPVSRGVGEVAEPTAPARRNQGEIDALDAMGALDPPAVRVAAGPSLDEQRRALLDAHGLIASDGAVRTGRARRLADTTPEGEAARRALAQADIEAALARLTSPRARAIAMALRS